MILKNLCVLVLWMKVASALEGLRVDIINKWSIAQSALGISRRQSANENDRDQVQCLVATPTYPAQAYYEATA